MDRRQLLSDLQIISSECRRKFPTIKQLTDAAADILSSPTSKYSQKSVFPSDLQVETTTTTTTTVDEQHQQRQLAIMTVMQPFLLALDTAIMRCVQISLSCLQRFVSISVFPAAKVDWLVMRLGEMMTDHQQQTLQRQLPQIQDHQLKALQLLLQLNMNYRLSLDSFSESLYICFYFFANVPAASLAAKATILQIIHRSLDQAESNSTAHSSSADEDAIILQRYENVVTGVSVDEMKAYLVIHDILKLLEQQPPVFLRLEKLENDAFCMELLSSILDHSPPMFRSRPPFGALLGEINVLLVKRSVSSDRTFIWMVRFLRLLKAIILHFIDIFVSPSILCLCFAYLIGRHSNFPRQPAESQVFLYQVIDILRSSTVPSWHKLLCMETVKEIFSVNQSRLFVRALWQSQRRTPSVALEFLSCPLLMAAEFGPQIFPAATSNFHHKLAQ